jgi:long-chain acyl-CoA synthetase
LRFAERSTQAINRLDVFAFARLSGSANPRPLNIVDSIAARTEAGKTAVVADGRRLSFGELLDRASEVADWLKASPGFHRAAVPRIGLACGNGLDYVALALGILKAGGCLVPIAGELTDEERREIIERTGLHGLLIGPDETWRTNECLPSREPGCGAGWIPLEEPALDCEAEFAELNPAFIRFSSGTTGRSKGVVLSHESLLARITAANQVLQIGPDDRVLWMLPMAHHFAVSIVLYLHFGACTVVGESHLATDVLELAEKESATVIYGSPFHHALLAADAGNFHWPQLRLPVSTAARLPEATARAFDARFGKPLVQGMGIIEVGLPLINLRSAREAPDSVGEPIPGFEIELRDVADGIGELWLRGPGMFDAYLSPWQPRAEVCDEGWFATGDLARIDEAGRVTLCGRKKSVLNIAGMKVFPEEIEAVLDRHPAVKQSRVYGREHEVLGSVVVAEVVLQSEVTAPALKAWCRQSLSAFKVPAVIQWVESVPLTASGKIRRHEVSPAPCAMPLE